MVAEQSEAIRVLLVEDVAFEAELSLAHLKRAGLLCSWARAETELELRRALQEFEPHIILSDFGLPQFDGMAALRIAPPGGIEPIATLITALQPTSSATQSALAMALCTSYFCETVTLRPRAAAARSCSRSRTAP